MFILPLFGWGAANHVEKDIKLTRAGGMKLSQAAALLNAEMVPAGAADVWIERLSCHPEKVQAEDCFGVFPEYFVYNQWTDLPGSEAAACRVQPRVIIAAKPIAGYNGTLLKVADPRAAFGQLARAFYGFPDRSLALIGVTGTNGKTTTTHIIAHLLERVAGSGGTMGTLGTFRNGVAWRPGEFTTDLALPTVQTLARFVREQTAGVAMEVSSHGLALDRVAGLHFQVAVLTNVTRDHLDFHGSLEAYVAAKERLFRQLDATAVAVLNADDPHAARIMASTAARVITYGWGPTADWRVEEADLRADGASMTVRIGSEVIPWATRLVGRFQIANVLAAAAAVASLGHDPKVVLEAVADFMPVSGRMEVIPLRGGGTAIIDFAHNPDGLENLLTNCRAMRPRRVLLVFGCGGDRDRGKRPLMGAIAAQRADRVWITSDNPRTEDPKRILQDIVRGTEGASGITVEPNRAVAIRAAWEACEQGDLLLIAGKGHEDYQIVGTTKIPFSDRAEVLRLEAIDAG